MSNWHKFYKDRVNTRYQDYFEERYKPFLSVIQQLNTDKGIFELGCGIGSVSKAIGGVFKGIDYEQGMVDLANENTSTSNFSVGNMFDIAVDHSILSVTHGVLEHYSDDLINYVCETFPNSVHYVPLDKYATPSFGDERLLPFEHWLDIAKPKYWELFNDDHDLLFTL